MKILIIANGIVKDKVFYQSIIEESELTICADGGLNNAQYLDITPEIIIGDLDSITPEQKIKYEDIIRHEPNQDKTDLMKALEYSQLYKPNSITVIGAIGERIDHSISNILTIKNYPNAKIIDENNEVIVISQTTEIKANVGENLSIIAIDKVTNLEYTGLKWNPKTKDVEPGWNGICNKVISLPVRIHMDSGKLIVMKSNDNWDN